MDSAEAIAAIPPSTYALSGSGIVSHPCCNATAPPMPAAASTLSEMPTTAPVVNDGPSSP